MLSIIVVTTDRLFLIQRLFMSLRAQDSKAFEVFFVYGPTVSHEEAQRLAETLDSVPVKSIPSHDHCLSRSRNIALPHVRGDIVTIADDDCVYAPDTVSRVHAAFAQNPDTGVIMGVPVDIGHCINSQANKPEKLNCYNLFRACPSYVHFYRADVVHAVGLFNEQLGVGCDTDFQSGEDTDYVLRALQKGFSIVRIHSIAIQHPTVNLHNPALREKVSAYAAGRMRLLHNYNLPIWFILANVVYPIVILPFDCIRYCIHSTRYRWNMLMDRVQWFKRCK